MTPSTSPPAPPPRSGTRPRKTRDTLYCSVSARLMECALTVTEAMAQSLPTDDIDEAGTVGCNVLYRSARVAAKSCSTLKAFRQQRSTNEGSTEDARPALVDSSGSRLQCTLEDLLPYGDFRALAQDVTLAAVGTALMVEKRLKKLATTYTQLFDPSTVVNVTVDAARGVGAVRSETMSWTRRVVEDHGNLVDFLRLFLSLCSSEKPPEGFADHPQHAVKIIDLATVSVDGVRVPFNEPRKAALFTLVVTGTENIHVETFARVYDNYLTGNDKPANFWKTFAQAMQGLQKSLPFLRVVKERPNHRTILGLSVKSAVDPNELEKWLRGRKQKIDPAQQLQNS